MKKISAIILCAAACTSLTACGVSASGDAQTEQTTAATVTEATTVTETESTAATQTASASKTYLTKDDISVNETIENSEPS